jgi:pimeloyl-ACP methyl ester carboxylesterase
MAPGDASNQTSSDAPNPGHPDRRLLLINGLGSPLVAFEPGFVDGLAASGVSVARFDNRDTGRSSKVSGTPGAGSPLYSVSDMAADAVAVLDALGWRTAHVLGQSMGGMIAQVIALEHPERVDSLIALMSASGERGFGLSTDDAKRALLQPAPSDPEAWLEHRLATEKIWASPEHWSPEWVTAKAKAMLDHGIDPKGTARQFRAVMAAGSRDVALAGLNTPTLVVHGSADTLIQPDGGRHLADVIPGAAYIEVEGLGHDLPPPFWPQLTTIVTDFIDSV